MDPFLKGQKFLARKSIEWSEGGFKSRFQVYCVVVFPVRGSLIRRGLLEQWYKVVIFLRYQSSNFVILGIVRGFTERFLEGLEEFVNRDAAREFLVFGR